MLLAALLGFVFGFLGSIPVAGPISALVVTRGIEGRNRAGLFIALGGGVAEAAYAFLAFWGFSTYLTQYPVIVPISRGGGAIVLLVLGIIFVRKRAEDATVDYAPRDSALGNFALGAWLCLINPTLIATWSAVVTGLYSTEAVDFSSAQALPFAIGCGLGIAGWFVTVLGLIRRYRGRFSRVLLAKVVRVMGVVLLLLASWFAWRFVQYFVSPGDDPEHAAAASSSPAADREQTRSLEENAPTAQLGLSSSAILLITWTT